MSVGRRGMRGTLGVLGCWLSLQMLGCAGGGEPQLEIWRDGAFAPVAVRSHEVEGKRDGATTVASISLLAENEARLRVELAIQYDPTPTLQKGSWSSTTGDGGDIRAESVEFAGGQGEGPSVGGLFILELDGEPHYRVKLPLMPVAPPQWTVD